MPSETREPDVRIIIGVDTGGTFTDFVARLIPSHPNEPERTFTHKVLSTPHDPGEAVLTGLDQLLALSGLRTPARERKVVHGSTVATNALLERKGVRTAFVTTEGFTDILHIGRQVRRELYSLRPKADPFFVPPEGCFGVNERVDAAGYVLEPLTESSIDTLVTRLRHYGATSVAVCLLFSFLAPEHEKRIAARLREAGFFVSASHEILPEHREYERAATTAVNAYVSPLMERYLKRLEQGLKGRGIERMHVMQSNGGTISPGIAGTQGVHTVLSGPAGGVVGAASAARRCGRTRIITFDMGGTSTDVSLVPGTLQVTTEGTIDNIPVRIPLLAIHTVGAGGGSLATIDRGGALRVGPRSAGAVPGPAAYGRGGTEPTVTDAHVVLGRLPADAFLGGRLVLDVVAARRAVASLADRLGASLDETAWSIVQVANVQMERALRVISIEKGFDPRDFTLVAFGGAGGLHAVDLARGLGIPEVFVPANPGVLSAWGMTVADVVKYASQGMLGLLTDMVDHARRALQGLIHALADELREEAHLDGTVTFEPSLDVRYFGQSFELTVPLPPQIWRVNAEPVPRQPAIDLETVREQFHAAHEARYTYRSDADIELVAVRVRAWCRGTPEHEPAAPETPSDYVLRLPGKHAQSEAFIDGERRRVPVYRRSTIPRGLAFAGPCLIVEDHATVVLGANDQAWLDAQQNLIISVGAFAV